MRLRLVRQHYSLRATAELPDVDSQCAEPLSACLWVRSSRGFVALGVMEQHLTHGLESGAPDGGCQDRIELALDENSELAQTEVEPFFRADALAARRGRAG